MELINGTGYDAAATEAVDHHGRAHLLVVLKASFALPDDDAGLPVALERQRGLLDTDLFEGEPGLSSPLIEADFCLRKSRCDVLFVGSAHAPGNAPATRLEVGLRVGSLDKRLIVHGDRRWTRRFGFGTPTPSRPQPFRSMPLTWSRAFGGTWAGDGEREEPTVCSRNPVGCGYAPRRRRSRILGTAVPNLEAPGRRVRKATGAYEPAGLGPLGRSWEPRAKLAGTYDQAWLDQVFPRLPQDFDEAFFQCAPPDQRIAFPRGGERLELLNLTPGGGRRAFCLPSDLDLPMAAILAPSRAIVTLSPVVDTLVVDGDNGSFDLVWRASLPLKRSLREIGTLGIGKVCKSWWKSRVFGTSDCGCGGKETDEEDLAPVTQALADVAAPGKEAAP
ncbi:hypothetical protein GLE_3333 [Lysobacter enzymogenes]|uniref:Uncharacterized protein n=1 Tax=Lysobacter enzymogenes TaxID=69 RepID=A0A0S2DJ71_LYSEN|nr:DUF2169 domain-containing protein [Lysobacter enzymogenes]ALN58679.1 hypothetical protein GLE_3333 [Lysobacter enzymogenes]QCW26999.1 DUF2169 domain-containing protein [Lysobacter enzymogenes]